MVNYRQLGIDLPVMESLAILPYLANRRQVSNYSADTIVSDGERYIYRFFDFESTYNNKQFWRYDTYTDSWQQLSVHSYTGTNSARPAMVYCKCRRIVYTTRSQAGATNFLAYDTTKGTFTSLTNLPSGASTDPDLVHTCSGISSSGNDDYIYYATGSAGTLYRYSISGNSWSTMATVSFTGLSGFRMFWTPVYDADKIMGVATIEGLQPTYKFYSISGNSVTGVQYFNNLSSSYSYAGSHTAYSPERNEIYWLQGNGEESLSEVSRYRSILKATIVEGVITNEQASGGTTTTVVSAIGGHKDNDYIGKKIVITAGAGAGQVGVIKSNTDNTFTIHTSNGLTAWSVAPNATSTFSVSDNIIENGTVTSSTSTVITDSTKNFSSISGIIRIIAGTGSGQERVITTNTATTITTPAWSVTPDNTSVYVIIRSNFIPDARLPLNDSWATTYGLISRNMCTMRIKGIDYVYVIPGGSKGEWFRYATVNK